MCTMLGGHIRQIFAKKYFRDILGLFKIILFYDGCHPLGRGGRNKSRENPGIAKKGVGGG